MFTTTQHFSTPGLVFSMVSADLKDGKPDLAAIAVNQTNFTATLKIYLKQ